jgi:hypothetical protein
VEVEPVVTESTVTLETAASLQMQTLTPQQHSDTIVAAAKVSVEAEIVVTASTVTAPQTAYQLQLQ